VLGWIGHQSREGRNRSSRRTSLRGTVLCLAGLLLFLVTSAGLTLGVHRMIRSHAESQFDHKADAIEKSVVAEIDRYRVALADVAAAVTVLDRVDAASFANLTEPLNRHRLPGVAAISFVVAAAPGEVLAVQEHWRALGNPGLQLRPTGTGEHYFSVLSRPLDGMPQRLGIDAAAAREVHDVLLRARSTGEMAMSRAYRLLRDAALPPEEQQLSFVLAAPVAGADVAWVVMALRGTDFLREVIGYAAADDADVTLSEFGTSVVTVADWHPSQVDTSLPGREATVDVPQRAWRLDIRPTVSLLPPTGLGLHTTAALLGSTLAAMLAVPVTTLWIARDRAAREVIRATAALQADISRREQVELQLRTREAELVGFAGVVAHDLRTPLATVAGYVEALRDETAGLLADDHREFLDRMHAGTHRMHSMLEDLLAYATADSMALRATDVDLAALVEDITREWRGSRSPLPPRFEVNALPTAVGDPTLLRQVFDNLISNAVKYTEPGTPATVEISAVESGPSMWRISIADRGIGIPPEDRPHVFDPFTRVGGSERFPGTGLGLAIVRRVVERHGGSIEVHGNRGGGSRFTFTVPAVPMSGRAEQNVLCDRGLLPLGVDRMDSD
jgi:signal transduction histidine kinase